MIKKGIALSIFIFSFSTLHAQTNSWVWQYPNPQGNTLNSVFFIDSLTGWTVGAQGTILKTIDSGTNWELQYFSSSSHLSSIFFINPEIGWAVGHDSSSSGTILKTTNGGINWTQIDNRKYYYSSIYFVNDKLGWVVGSDNFPYDQLKWKYWLYSGNVYVFSTIDGGLNWALSYATQWYFPGHIQFIDEETGWFTADRRIWQTGDIFTYSYLYKTIDGGKTWESILNTYPMGVINYIKLINENKGLVQADGLGIFCTRDSGNTWAYYYQDQPWGATFFLDENDGWTIGHKNYYKTIDGGETWTSYDKNSFLNFNSAFFLNNQIGLAVGESGAITKTNDGGITWIDQSNTLEGSLQSIFFQDENIGWAVGGYNKTYSGIVLYTKDGGDNWINFNIETDYWLQAIQFGTDKVGWMCGYNSDKEGAIFKTTNGGLNWEKLPMNWDSSLRSLSCLGNNFCVVVGEKSFVKITDNGMICKGSNENLNSVCYIDENNGWIVGNNGFIEKISFEKNIKIESKTTKNLLSVHFIDSTTGWIVGTGGCILKTNDCGITWEDYSLNKESVFQSVKFLDKSNGWIVSNTGEMYKTTNGGINWILLPKVTNNDLNSIYFLDDKIGWIAGESGTIIHTTNGGFTNIDSQLNTYDSERLTISQNYPNPFNPVTSIKYSIQRKSFVELKIYNSIGQCISTLVNQEQMPGNYKVTFDGTNYSTGIYFCKITTDINSECKKMLLIK